MDEKPKRTPLILSVDISLDFQKLKDEIEDLREELSKIFFERDELLFVICKNIEAAYLLSFGALEYKAYEIGVALRRLKRKLEMIQARKNKQEKIIEDEIEKYLDAEFALYQENLNKQIEKMNAALERRNAKLLTDEESKEIKKLYRAIVKALHPDLHPDFTDAKIKLFHNALAAYENGDLKELRIIHQMISDPALPSKDTDILSQMYKEKDRLLELSQSVKNTIELTKTQYPYTMKEIVDSPKKTESKKDELEKEIEGLNKTLAAYKAKIQEMLG